MRLVGRGDAVGNRDVAHDRHHGRHGDLRVGGLHDGVDIERRTHEAVRSAVGPRQHRQAADLPPVAENRQLVVVKGRIGHHLTLPSVVDFQFAVAILEDRAVARRIGNRQVEPRLHAVGQVGSVDAELLLRKFGHGLVHGGEIVEHILRPDAQPHDGARVAGTFVDRLGQEQQVGDQPGFVHAVGDADVVTCGRERPVFRGPEDGLVRVRTATHDAPREDVEVGERIFAPVHRPARDGHAVGSEVNGAGAGFGLRREDGQRSGAQHRQERCFHRLRKFWNHTSSASNRMLNPHFRRK